jgi:hypothetical protein
MALAELKNSFQQLKICHEQCNLARQQKEKIILEELKRKPKKIEARILKEWQDNKNETEFKKELIDIISLSNGASNPPVYLEKYLSDAGANKELIREIISHFKLSNQDLNHLKNNLEAAFKKDESETDKIQDLKTLAEIEELDEADYYFGVIDSDNSLLIKLQAIKNIGSINSKLDYQKINHLEIIERIATNTKTEARLRQNLVQMLGDYHLKFPEESLRIWQEVYRNTSFDNISRAFSADNLNNFNDSKLELPAISAQEWDDYYNQ